MRYYDSANDPIVKGIIDLSDVESISQGGSSFSQMNLASSSSSQQYNAKIKALNDDKSCFELKTSKRVYYFSAKSAQEATKWKDLIESCIDS